MKGLKNYAGNMGMYCCAYAVSGSSALCFLFEWRTWCKSKLQVKARSRVNVIDKYMNLHENNGFVKCVIWSSCQYYKVLTSPFLMSSDFYGPLNTGSFFFFYLLLLLLLFKPPKEPWWIRHSTEQSQYSKQIFFLIFFFFFWLWSFVCHTF